MKIDKGVAVIVLSGLGAALFSLLVSAAPSDQSDNKEALWLPSAGLEPAAAITARISNPASLRRATAHRKSRLASRSVSITCSPDISVSNDRGRCSAVVNYPPPATSGGPATVSCVPSSGSTFAVGVTAVTCTATGPTGDTAQCTFHVTVRDTEPPTLTCPAPITASAGADCKAPIPNFLSGVTVVDNCSTSAAIRLTQTPPAGLLAELGTTSVTITATDAAGNRETCTTTFTVIDNTAPIIACPTNLIVNTEAGKCSATVNFPAPIVTDNCSRTVRVTFNPASGSVFNPGSYVVTCKATDEANNSAECSFMLTVRDAEPPVISRPNAIQMIANSPTGSVAVFGLPDATDNCSGVTVSCAPRSGSVFPIGVSSVVCTALDSAGNSARSDFTVTVTGPTFDLCAKDAATGNYFLAVRNVPRSDPNFGYWEFHRIRGPGLLDEIFFGRANTVTVTAFVISMKDTASSTYELDATLNPFSHVAKVKVKQLPGGQTTMLTDGTFGAGACP